MTMKIRRDRFFVKSRRLFSKEVILSNLPEKRRSFSIFMRLKNMQKKSTKRIDLQRNKIFKLIMIMIMIKTLDMERKATYMIQRKVMMILPLALLNLVVVPILNQNLS